MRARSRRPRAYLSGGMEYARNEGSDWRASMEEWLKTNLGHSAFNPPRESARFLKQTVGVRKYRALKGTNIVAYRAVVEAIVRRDTREVMERADYVICLWDRSAQRGAGTSGEVTLARWGGKPVYLVSRLAPKNVPGWILGCATRIFSSFGELEEFLRSKYIRTRRTGKS